MTRRMRQILNYRLADALGRTLRGGLLALVLAGAALTDAPPSDAAPRFGRGVNILPHSYDPIWTDRRRALFNTQTFDELRRAGFDTVRVPAITWTHTAQDFRPRPEFLSALDWVVAEASRAGLNVILDFHDFRSCGADADACEKRLTVFWSQIAPRYANAPKTVTFELLNEPQGQINPTRYAQVFDRILKIVRQTNPTRTVLLCAPLGGTIAGLKQIVLPNDPNITVDVHYYEPYSFTHQGSPDTPRLALLRHVAWGQPSDYRKLNEDFDEIVAWRAAHKVQVYLGEFGTINFVDPQYRARWTAAVARAAEARRLPWAYWELSAEYGLYDLKTKQWNPGLLRALVPAK